MFSHPDAQLPRAAGFSVAEGKIVELDAIADPELRSRAVITAVVQEADLPPGASPEWPG
jgi:hypothetical protein